MEYYYISWAQKKGEIILQPLEDYDEKQIKVGNVKIEHPLRVKILKGKRFYDLCYFSDPFNFAISEKLRSILIENNVTGWSSYLLDIVDSGEKYYGFQVIGKCGPLKRPSTAGWVTGYEFDFKTWDKTHFFCPEGTLHVFFTLKVKEIIETNKITNFGITKANDKKWYSA